MAAARPPPPGDWADRALEASPDAIVTVDARGRVVQCNRAAERIFRYTREEVLDLAVTELIVQRNDAAGCSAESLVAATASEVLDHTIELRAVRKGGEASPAEVTVTTTSDAPLLLTGFVRDVSASAAPAPGGSSKERLLSAAEALTHAGSWEHHLQTGRVLWTDEVYRLLGFEPGEVPPSMVAGAPCSRHAASHE